MLVPANPWQQPRESCWFSSSRLLLPIPAPPLALGPSAAFSPPPARFCPGRPPGSAVSAQRPAPLEAAWSKPAGPELSAQEPPLQGDRRPRRGAPGSFMCGPCPLCYFTSPQEGWTCKEVLSAPGGAGTQADAKAALPSSPSRAHPGRPQPPFGLSSCLAKGTPRMMTSIYTQHMGQGPYWFCKAETPGLNLKERMCGQQVSHTPTWPALGEKRPR